MPELSDGRGVNPIGIIMSMHLYEAQHENASDRSQLRLLCSYENGSVMLWGYSNREKTKSVEGVGWELLWNVKLHVESGELHFHSQIAIHHSCISLQLWLWLCQEITVML